MENKIALSILIPTRNREEYTFRVILQILSLKYNNFQLVVQDNSDTDLLRSEISNVADERLNYYYENRELSFVENFNLGLEMCKGEYVTIIGDDDGLNLDIFKITEWAFSNNIDVITPALSHVYFWPKSGVKSVSDSGTLVMSEFNSKIRFVNAREELEKFLRNGCHNYLEYSLGKAYHGVVKKSILESIKVKTGSYIGGLTPDIYLSIAISLLAEKCVVIDHPLTISGICKKSGSSDSATGKHTGNLDDAPHFKGHKNYVWSTLIPPFYSVETIWADTVMAAIHDLGESSL